MRLAVSRLVSLLIVLAGCTSTVTPPPPTADSMSVYLIRNAKHVGLILPRDSGGFVEFGYGDWDWYARDRDRWYHVFDTIIWPTAGALGRRDIAVLDAAAMRRRYHWLEYQEIEAPVEAVTRLRDGLERQIDARLDQGLFSLRYNLFFVPHDERFWFPHTCVDQTAEWLEEIGCHVSWTPIRASLEVTRVAVP